MRRYMLLKQLHDRDRDIEDIKYTTTDELPYPKEQVIRMYKDRQAFYIQVECDPRLYQILIRLGLASDIDDLKSKHPEEYSEAMSRITKEMA